MLGQSVFKFENRLTNRHNPVVSTVVLTIFEVILCHVKSVEIVKKSSFIKYNNVKNYQHHGANNRIILN